MKMLKTKFLVTLLLALPTGLAFAQEFNSGSTGANGALNVTTSTTLNLPPDGILNYTTINVAAGVTLKFNRNALNTPVYLLAQSNVTINGTIDVSGNPGTSVPPAGGSGGPGGFDGGMPGFDTVPPGAGFGPGGGRGGVDGASANSAGSGSYATVTVNTSSVNRGATYGSPLLVPLVGGSGGGGLVGTPGAAGEGGSGGGGAILIASSSRITISGSIFARGGENTLSPTGQGYLRNGSGGAVRLVAPGVSGGGSIDARGGLVNAGYGGLGRIRIDTIDRSTLKVNFLGLGSVGGFMAVFPTPLPRLDILQVADTAIPEGIAAPVQIQLPFGSATNRTVTIQARDFNGSVPINVVLTPETGVPRVYPVTINNAASNPASITVPVNLPANTLVTVNAWTR